jgi:hypothetical protein
MNYRLLGVLSVLAFLLASPAWAFTESPTGVTFTVSYTEPTTNTAGGPPNLSNTTIYYKLGTGTESSLVVPATSTAGGGVITKPVTVPILPGQVGTINVQVTASNSAGESVRTGVVSKTDDRSGQVVDTPPSNLTVN